MKLRALVTTSLLSLAIPLSASAQEAGYSTSTVGNSPWTSDRAIGEGAGIKTGSVEWHPGVSGEFGLDTNYLQRSSSAIEQANYGPVVPSLRLRVTPQLSLRTLDRSDESGKDQRKVPKPVVMFDASAIASYNEFIALRDGFGSDFSKLRNVEGGGGLGLSILPGRAWSGTVGGGYSYIAEPSNQGGFGTQQNRHLINAGVGLQWAPGGGMFKWTLIEYGARVTFFNDNPYGVYDNGNHHLKTHGMWRFLPKTAMLFDSELQIVRYKENILNDGEVLQARLGLNGLLTRRLALLVMGGWANSFYNNDNGVGRNFNDFVGNVEAKYFISVDGKLKEGSANVGASAIAVGVIRDYNDSYLGDFYRRNRGYAQMSYLFGGNVVTTLEGGVSRIDYPDYFTEGVGQQTGFGETRIDVKGFAEYRPMPSMGLSLQIRYDQNISQVVDFPDYSDDLSFNRFRAMAGVRWFM